MQSICKSRVCLLISSNGAAPLNCWCPQVTVTWGHGRLMEPPSRASMWRLGYPNPADYNDNQGFCGGFQVGCTQLSFIVNHRLREIALRIEGDMIHET